MQFKKVLTMTLVLILSLSLLAACGSGTTNSSSNEGNQGANSTGSNDNTVDAGEQVVNVYTARHYEVDGVLYNKFTEETGIKVNIIEGKAEELIERIKREGESTEADLFITVDGGVLSYAKQNDILQAAESDVINANVPEQLRDADNHWIGLSTRARVIVYSKERVSPDQLSTYEDLASDKWENKLLVRSSTNLYNISLLASLIELNGEEKATEWVNGIAKNLAREPEGGDRDQAKGIVAGIGDVGIMNTYYVGQLLNSADPEEVKVGESIGVFFPNQDTTGTHINISGAGLTKYSKNKENAVKLIEFLTGEEAQSIVTQTNFEFPVNSNAELPELLQSWGEFKTQEINFDMLWEHNKKAVETLTKSDWK